MDHLVLRNGNWSLRRRVPVVFADVETRREIWVSLHTDSRNVARTKAQQVWQELVAHWQALLDGKSEDAQVRYLAATRIAEQKGFLYSSIEDLLKGPTQEILERLDAISAPDGVPNMAEASALLGIVEAPKVTLSQALEIFWELSRDQTLGKSPDQIRRWQNPVIKAVNNFISVIGDKAIDEISRVDMLGFRSWWVERIENEGLSQNSANKDLIHLGKVLRTVNELKQLGIDLPLSGLSLKEKKHQTRPAFSRAWLQDHILAPAALDGLNAQARAILLVLINTGARPSEIANLKRDHICLEQSIPYIRITADGRQLKSDNAERVIPLAGCSLKAIKEFPEGFPQYRDKPGLSATLNKFLRANNLMETPDHVVYSIRHGFEDRLRRAGIDDRLRAE